MDDELKVACDIYGKSEKETQRAIKIFQIISPNQLIIRWDITPLEYSIRYCKQCVQHLLEIGASPNCSYAGDMSVLCRILLYPMEDESKLPGYVRLLLRYGANPCGAPCPRGTLNSLTPLIIVARMRSIYSLEIMQILLDAGAYRMINSQARICVYFEHPLNWTGNTEDMNCSALSACYSNAFTAIDIEKSRLLLEYGASPNKEYWTDSVQPLLILSKIVYEEGDTSTTNLIISAMKLLLDYNANIYVSDGCYSPFVNACINDSSEIVDALLRFVPSIIDHQTSEEALFESISNGAENVTKLLIKAGVSIDDVPEGVDMTRFMLDRMSLTADDRLRTDDRLTDRLENNDR